MRRSLGRHASSLQSLNSRTVKLTLQTEFKLLPLREQTIIEEINLEFLIRTLNFLFKLKNKFAKILKLNWESKAQFDENASNPHLLLSMKHLIFSHALVFIVALCLTMSTAFQDFFYVLKWSRTSSFTLVSATIIFSAFLFAREH